MRTCRCPRPEPKLNRPRQCVRCGGPLGSEWTSSDETLAAFFDRVEQGFPSWPTVPEWWQSLRLQCEARELAGRSTFGMRYLSRDNIAEAFEEIADGMLYLYLEQLVSLRMKREQEIDVVLTAAYHMARAYEALVTLRHKHRGTP